ncbi:hypothetical protein EDM80_13830 [bacterium]|nr:MAG: hypothetical protein EDM80_13830 [bacterium]RIK63356.1 MAG: hypothetical protein DCC64_07300 [Planctomycetota bacterium]
MNRASFSLLCLLACALGAGLFFTETLADRAPDRPKPRPAESPAPPEPAKARQLALLTEYFDAPEVVISKSEPPQFSLTFRKQLPSEWKLKLDSCEAPTPGGVIVVKVTLERPDYEAAQVVREATVSASLGALTPGKYLVQVMLRVNSGDYEHAAACLLHAKE